MIRKNWPSRTAARRIGFPFFCTGSLLTSRDIDTFRPVDLIRNLIRSVPPVQKHKRKEKIRPLLPILLTRAGNKEVKKKVIFIRYMQTLSVYLIRCIRVGWGPPMSLCGSTYARRSRSLSILKMCVCPVRVPRGDWARESEKAHVGKVHIGDDPKFVRRKIDMHIGLRVRREANSIMK